jgi:hypothetical protein
MLLRPPRYALQCDACDDRSDIGYKALCPMSMQSARTDSAQAWDSLELASDACF